MRVDYKRMADFLGPIGGTVLALLVVPIAIEQYPEIFKENRWILPVSVVAVLACWCIPLFLHHRFVSILRRTADRGPVGISFGLLLAMLFVSLASSSSSWLFRLHTVHLDAALRKKANPSPKTEAHQENAYAPNGNAATGNAVIKDSPVINYSVDADPLRLKIQKLMDAIAKFGESVAKDGAARHVSDDGEKLTAFSHETAKLYYKTFGKRLREIARDLKKRPYLKEKGDFVLARLKGYSGPNALMDTGTIDHEVEDLGNILRVVR